MNSLTIQADCIINKTQQSSVFSSLKVGRGSDNPNPHKTVVILREAVALSFLLSRNLPEPTSSDMNIKLQSDHLFFLC